MKKTTKRNHKRKGFTLVELIAVMAILGILAMLIIPRFADMSEGAQLKVFENTVRSMASNASLHIAQHNGAYPTTDADVTSMLPSDWATSAGGSGPISLTWGTKAFTAAWTSSKGDPYTMTYDMITSELSRSWTP